MNNIYRHSCGGRDAGDCSHHEGGELQEDGGQGRHLRQQLRGGKEEGASDRTQQENALC